MTKKCAHCGKPIDVSQGNYVNSYSKPFEMEGYHTKCYQEKIVLELEMDDSEVYEKNEEGSQ